jgi:hypothetical protein
VKLNFKLGEDFSLCFVVLLIWLVVFVFINFERGNIFFTVCILNSDI